MPLFSIFWLYRRSEYRFLVSADVYDLYRSLVTSEDCDLLPHVI